MASKLKFAPPFSSHMVLQQAPSRASLHGSFHVANVSSTLVEQPRLLLTLTAIDAKPHQVIHEAEAHLESPHGSQARVLGVEPWATWFWRSLLPPITGSDGARYSISVHQMAGSTAGSSKQQQRAPHTGSPLRAEISHVVFGDVWLCAGQSNMQHPLGGTLNRNRSLARVLDGRYDHVHFLPSDYHADDSLLPQPTSEAHSHWTTARFAVRNSSHVERMRYGFGKNASYDLFTFCAACWYFAESLTDAFVEAHRPPPTIGLICSAAGGSHIEQYFPPDQPAKSFCNHVFAGTTGREELPSLYPRHVQPLLGLTVKGFLFWQGENNLATNAISGNSVGRYGYGCELPALIRTWRALWSNSFGGVAPNTTAPDAPFGIVTLHTEAGWMGARDFGGMRWAQTANYGVAPNPALPNTFVAQAYDLPDPWYIRPMCDEWHCCTVHPFAPHDVSKAGLARLDSCNKSTAALGGPAVCAPFCQSRQQTPPGFMGNLHSRLKRPIGQRLARAAFAQVYDGDMASTGPTLSGCSLQRAPLEHGIGNETLLIRFNTSLLRGERLTWRKTAPPVFEVLTDPSGFCVQPMQRCALPPVLGPPLPPSHLTSPDAKAAHVPSTQAPLHRHPHLLKTFEVPAHRCGESEREWFCPESLHVHGSNAYRPASTAISGGLTDFAYVYGGPRALKPVRGDQWEQGWREVDIIRVDATSATATLDLSPLLGVPLYGIRYAWGASTSNGGEKLCCRDVGPLLGLSKPCRPSSCALMASGGLPVNPFLAQIVQSRCKCLEPQVCDG